MNQSSNSSSGASRVQRSHANFIEALKSIGGQTTSSVSHDVIGGIGSDFIQSLTGGSRPKSSEMNQAGETEQSSEARIREEVWRLERHREISATKLFDRKEEEAKAKIEVIQEELKLLAAELSRVDKQLEKAIKEEVANPGVYHVNFFEKLRRLIINLRKQVVDSSAWLEMSNQRKAAKGGYWANVKKSGSKYLMSQERTMATQAG
jgi:hypothetical protein